MTFLLQNIFKRFITLYNIRIQIFHSIAIIDFHDKVKYMYMYVIHHLSFHSRTNMILCSLHLHVCAENGELVIGESRYLCPTQSMMLHSYKFFVHPAQCQLLLGCHENLQKSWVYHSESIIKIFENDFMTGILVKTKHKQR